MGTVLHDWVCTGCHVPAFLVMAEFTPVNTAMTPKAYSSSRDLAACALTMCSASGTQQAIDVRLSHTNMAEAVPVRCQQTRLKLGYTWINACAPPGCKQAVGQADPLVHDVQEVLKGGVGGLDVGLQAQGDFRAGALLLAHAAHAACWPRAFLPHSYTMLRPG